MKRFLPALLFLLFYPDLLFSQETVKPAQRIVFSGIVRDGSSLSPIPGVSITVNSLFRSVSSTDGSFSLSTARKDTIVFRALGYKNETVYVSDTLSGDEYMAGIYMKGDTVAIGEVVIIPRYRNMRSEIMNASPSQAAKLDNARYNVAISAYQGRTTTGVLGDPAANYDILRGRQKMNAYTAGQIPPDRMVSVSPLLLIPAAYLLVKGMPEKPPAFSPRLTDEELKSIEQEYFRTLRQKNR